jgi:hypothetical protein
MKKFTILALVLACISGWAQAQTITAKGVIKNLDGDLLHFAFVQDKAGKHAAYTDSLGNFTIEVSPHAILNINCTGYRDTVVSVNNQTSFAIVMHLSGVNIIATKPVVTESANSKALKQEFSDEIMLKSGFLKKNENFFDFVTGSILPVFRPRDETQGSRYFFKGWVHGYVVTSKDSIVQNSGFKFDYDKIGGGLLLTKDQKSAIEIDKDLIKSFTLYDNLNKPYTFERVPQIDNNHYIQVMANGNKYKIYKATKTSFIRANYSTDGLSSTGNNYDEYIDDNTYYVYDVKTQTLQKLAFKKKSIKEAFTKDQDKLNKFMADHSSDDIDEFYLVSLGSYMNE